MIIAIIINNGKTWNSIRVVPESSFAFSCLRSCVSVFVSTSTSGFEQIRTQEKLGILL